MAKLLLIRGIPGSGKSTMARASGLFHVESDMFRVNPRTGKYEYDKKLNQKIHKMCLNTVESTLRYGVDVVVSNTFTKLSYIAPYVLLAGELGVELQIKVANYPGVSKHNVPESEMQKYRDRWEELPEEWKGYE